MAYILFLLFSEWFTGDWTEAKRINVSSDEEEGTTAAIELSLIIKSVSLSMKEQWSCASILCVCVKTTGWRTRIAASLTDNWVHPTFWHRPNDLVECALQHHSLSPKVCLSSEWHLLLLQLPTYETSLIAGWQFNQAICQFGNWNWSCGRAEPGHHCLSVCLSAILDFFAFQSFKFVVLLLFFALLTMKLSSIWLPFAP